MTRLPVLAMISAGWATFKRRSLFFVVVTFCAGLVPLMTSQFLTLLFIPDGAEASPIGNVAAFQIISALIQSFITLCVYRLALAAVDHIETVTWEDMWMPQPRHLLPTFAYFIIASLLYTVLVGIGIVLLVIPGLVLASMLGFSLFTVADRAIGPIDALWASYRLTKGNLWPIFLLGVTLAILNLLGIAALLIGLLVTLPISGLTAAHAYRFLSGSESQDVAAPAPR